MTGFKYKYNFKVELSDSTFTRSSSPMSILTNMEIMAANHSDILKTGFDDAQKLGFFWILRSTKFVFNKIPHLDDELEVTTWPAGIDGLRILRKYEYKMNEEVIGYGYNTWVMFDSNSRKLIVSNFYEETIKAMPISKVDFFKLGKIIAPKDMTLAYQKQIMNSDIDMNNHLNNVRYAELVYNAIPHEILVENDICEMQLDFMKECVLNDVIDIYIKNDQNKLYVLGKKDGRVKFKSVVVLNRKK